MTRGITLTLKCLGFHPSTQTFLIRLCIMFFIHNWLGFTESATIQMDSFLQLNFSNQGCKKKGLKTNSYLILSISFRFTMMFLTCPKMRLSKMCYNLYFQITIFYFPTLDKYLLIVIILSLHFLMYCFGLQFEI